MLSSDMAPMNWFYSYTGYRRDERHLIVPFVLVTTLFFF